MTEKTNERAYSIGEILRQGLLKALDGEPYKSKISISKLVNSVDFQVVKTKHGLGKGLTMIQIDELNARWNELS